MMSWARCVARPVRGIYFKIHSKSFHQSCQRLTGPSSLAEIKFRPFKSSLKVVSKRPKREPFVPRFLLGQIDEDLFEFPEMTSELLYRANDMVSVVQGFYNANINTLPSAGTLKDLDEEVFRGLRSLGLFGLQVPKLYGGVELCGFEMNRIAEVLCQNPAIFHLINFHNIFGVNILLSAGTEAQKQMYLPKLATGETMFGVCIWEKNCGSDLSLVETKATPLDADSFILEGTKIWVSNADVAEEFLVLANVCPGGSRSSENKLCLFLVNKNSPGITMKQVEVNTVEQLGMFEVSFNDTVVRKEQMVGDKGCGFALANSAIFSRTSIMPTAVVQTIKVLLNEAVNHVLKREQFGQPLYNFDSIKWKLADVSVRLYVLESMAYLTAGLHDEFEDQDTVVECAISKVHALDTLQYCLGIFSDIFSSCSLVKEFAPLKYFQNAPFFHVCEGTRDIMKLHISLNCLRYMGSHTHEKVTKLRNPLYFPMDKWKDFKYTMESSKDKPVLTHVIAENVHPSLKTAADTLEYCIKRLQWASDLNIVHFGAEITNHQHAMIGLADITIHCYAMAAAIARASRSYCIGIKDADLEVMAALSYTTENLARVRQLVEFVDPYHPPISRNTVSNLIEVTGSKKGYFAEHPTQRTYQ